MTPDPTCHLDDAAVLRVLSEATAEIRGNFGGESAVRTADEAVQVLEKLLDAGGIRHAPITMTQLSAASVGRALLARMIADPTTRPAVEPVAANPPADRQKSAELAMAGAVILGGLIAWLQTSIEIAVDRKEGKTEFSFRLRKGASSDEIVREAARQVAGMLAGGAPPAGS